MPFTKGLRLSYLAFACGTLAILCGDFILYTVVRSFCSQPSLSDRLKRWTGRSLFEKYQQAFKSWGGWTLFLARFTFGVRAVAYFAAGAVAYSWMRFPVVDGLSVAIQVLMFVGMGYCAGEKVEWAEATGTKIALLLSIAAILPLIFTWIYVALVRRVSNRNT